MNEKRIVYAKARLNTTLELLKKQLQEEKYWIDSAFENRNVPETEDVVKYKITKAKIEMLMFAKQLFAELGDE